MTVEVKSSCDSSKSDITSDDKRDKDIKKDGPKTKVVIRRLPPSMTEGELRDQLGSLPDHDFFNFVASDYSLGMYAVSRAYIHFLSVKDVIMFRDMFDGYVFVDTKGNEYPAVVELAPNQKYPKKKRKDVKCGTIEEDPEYIAFLEELKNPSKLDIPTLESCLEEIEKKEKEKKDKKDGAKTKTPLIEFIQWRQEEKQRRREERKRQDADRRRKRDEERRQRIEDERRWRREREEEERRRAAKRKEETSRQAPVQRFAKENRGESGGSSSKAGASSAGKWSGSSSSKSGLEPETKHGSDSSDSTATMATKSKTPPENEEKTSSRNATAGGNIEKTQKADASEPAVSSRKTSRSAKAPTPQPTSSTSPQEDRDGDKVSGTAQSSSRDGDAKKASAPLATTKKSSRSDEDSRDQKDDRKDDRDYSEPSKGKSSSSSTLPRVSKSAMPQSYKDDTPDLDRAPKKKTEESSGFWDADNSATYRGSASFGKGTGVGKAAPMRQAGPNRRGTGDDGSSKVERPSATKYDKGSYDSNRPSQRYQGSGRNSDRYYDDGARASHGRSGIGGRGRGRFQQPRGSGRPGASRGRRFHDDSYWQECDDYADSGHTAAAGRRRDDEFYNDDQYGRRHEQPRNPPAKYSSRRSGGREDVDADPVRGSEDAIRAGSSASKGRHGGPFQRYSDGSAEDTYEAAEDGSGATDHQKTHRGRGETRYRPTDDYEDDRPDYYTGGGGASSGGAGKFQKSYSGSDWPKSGKGWRSETDGNSGGGPPADGRYKRYGGDGGHYDDRRYPRNKGRPSMELYEPGRRRSNQQQKPNREK